MQMPWNQDEYVRAYRFAARAHTDQFVKGTRDLPYIFHVGVVAMEVIAALHVERELDGNLAVPCALLHDVIEDTRESTAPVTFEEVRTRFGERVATGVPALTKDNSLDKPLRMTDCLRRIRQQPPEVWMAKLADRITNLQGVPRGWHARKIASYRQEAIQIHDALAPASPFLAQRLMTKIEAYGRHQA